MTGEGVGAAHRTTEGAITKGVTGEDTINEVTGEDTTREEETSGGANVANTTKARASKKTRGISRTTSKAIGRTKAMFSRRRVPRQLPGEEGEA